MLRIAGRPGAASRYNESCSVEFSAASLPVMQNPRTFYVRNFGCRATQADGAGLERELSARGLEPAETASTSDVVIVNTCTVTHQADQDARQAIRRIHRENPVAEILVTGCYAQRRPSEWQRSTGSSGLLVIPIRA